jgi:hypothetical protein
MCALSEPVGAKAPKFSTETTITTMIRRSEHGLALLCQAQGFPVPSFR